METVLKNDDIQITLSNKLSAHLCESDTLNRYASNAHAFFKLFLDNAWVEIKNNDEILIEMENDDNKEIDIIYENDDNIEVSDYGTNTCFFTDNINKADITNCLELIDQYRNMIFDRIDQWKFDYCKNVPDYYDLIAWIKEDFLNLLIDNESVMFISKYLNVEPYQPFAYEIYQELRSRGKFRYPQSISELNEKIISEIHRIFIDFSKQDDRHSSTT